MLKIGMLMDPIDSIKTYKDTSFAMMLEAQARGWEIHYMQMQDLSMLQGKPTAQTQCLKVYDRAEDYYEVLSEQEIALSDLDAIFMRKDPPFDTEYIYATYMLERAEEQGTLIVNKPQSLRDCNEKLFTAWFADLTPTTLVTRSAQKLREFHQQHSDIIVKPLDGMGGSSIFRIKESDPNIGVIIETLTNQGEMYCMAQTFVPDISNGDKRIFIVDGEVMPYCLARVPAKGETRGNIAAGGTGEPRPISDTDRKIAQCIGPTLKEKGLIFVGIDVIGDKLTEINVTSPTCVREVEAAFDISIMGKLMDAVETKLG